MIDHETFLARVDACLDERRDPLDDPDVVAFLDAHPERLQAFAEQRADLRGLAASRGAPTAAPRARRRLLPLLATAAVAAGTTFALLFADPDDTPNVPRGGDPASAAPSRILSASIEAHAARAYASVDYTVFRPLVHDTHTTLETYELRSLQHKP